jgi:hypothetical protein
MSPDHAPLLYVDAYEKLSPGVTLGFATDTAAPAPPFAPTLFTMSTMPCRVSSGELARSILPRPFTVACHSSSMFRGDFT